MTQSHKHCLYCGLNIPQEDVFCTIRCQDTYESQRKKMVKTQRVMLVALVFIFALAVLMNLR